MDVAAVALALVELRHEGERFAVLLGDLLRTALVDRVLVGGLEHLGVAERDLLLAEVAFALDALAVHARAVHAAPDVAQQRLEPARGEQVVVDVVVGRRLEVAVALRPGVPVRVVEDDELELGARVGGEPALGEPVALVLEDRARRLDDGIAALPRRGPPSRARCPASTGCAGACRGRTAASCRRTPSPSSTSRSHRQCSCRRRPRGGSCRPPRRAGRPPPGRGVLRRACRRGGPARRRRRRSRCRSRRLRSPRSTPRR